MGEPAVAFLDAARFPLARELAPVEGELQELTPTIQGLVRPTSTRRSTSSRRRRRSGTPSRCSASGGARRPRTELGLARPRRSVVIVAAGVVTWDAVAPHLGRSPSGEVAIVAAAVLPATLVLIYLALPLWSNRTSSPRRSLVFLIAAIVTWETHHHLASNFIEARRLHCGGWMFLRLFEELAWVVLIALIIPFVDAISVAAGPTHTIVTHHFAVYSAVAVAFVAPGGRAAGSALPTSSSSPSSSRRRCAGGSGPGGRGWR